MTPDPSPLDRVALRDADRRRQLAAIDLEAIRDSGSSCQIVDDLEAEHMARLEVR